MEDDKKVKKQSVLLFVATLLFSTLLSINSNFQQLVQFPEHYLGSKEEVQLKGILSRFITLETGSSKQFVAVSSGMSNTLGSKKLEVSYKLFGIFPLKSAEVEITNPMKLIPAATPLA